VDCGVDAVRVIRRACEEADSLDSLVKAVEVHGIAFLEKCEKELKEARSVFVMLWWV